MESSKYNFPILLALASVFGVALRLYRLGLHALRRTLKANGIYKISQDYQDSILELPNDPQDIQDVCNE